MRLIQYFKDSESASDTNNQSGDGSSSGGSIHSDMVRAKWQRMSTRSSVQAATSTSTEGTLDSNSLPSAICDPQSMGVFGNSTNSDTRGATSATTAGTPTSRPRIVYGTSSRGANTTAQTNDVVTAHADDVASTNTDKDHPTNTNKAVPTSTNNVGSADTDSVDPANTDNLASADTNGAASTDPCGVVGTDANDVVAAKVLTAAPCPSSAASLDDIDAVTIPIFLLRHGKGKRQVNVFKYLKSVKDSHFQSVLFHYLRFEIADKSGSNGSLPTAQRPVELGYWTSRARPASLPDYTKGKRTFTAFVDSIFTWWASIQPDWRKFERGRVCCEVHGEWDALYAPGVNGLLNVVMLAYWWAKILEEDRPEDGVRADYELFADDVAWVLSLVQPYLVDVDV